MIGTKKNTHNWKSIVFSLFLLVVVALGIVYVRRPQDIRNKAALSGSILSMQPNAIQKPSGASFPVGIILNAGPDSVVAAELHILYDPQLIKITGFTPGRQLPIILTPAAMSNGTASITLGANPNAYFKGTDIIGTMNVTSLTDKPATITYSNATTIITIEKPTNTLVSSSGISINGGISLPPSSCSGPDGSECDLSDCPPCPPGEMCPMLACKLISGVCIGGQCKQEKCVPLPLCAYQNSTSVCRIGPTPPGGSVWCPGITPTPSPGCYYTQVNCVQAPCDPVIVCPTPTCIPLPECVYNPPIINGRPVPCSIPPLSPDRSYCPRPTPKPTCTPRLPCMDPPPGQTACLPSVIDGTWFCPATPTPTVSPTPIASCRRNKPTVTITPNNQSGRPGDMLLYTVSFVNTDSSGCGPSNFNLTAHVDTGWSYSPTNTTITNINPGSGGRAPLNITSKSNGFTGTTSVPVSAIIRNTASSLETQATAAYTVVTGEQNLEFKIRFAGVTDGSAEGAKIGVKFVKLGGETVQLSSALPVTHVGGGVYKAVATLTNPFPSGTSYVIKIKGEKHVAIKFCRSGQTGPCADNETIVSIGVPPSISFDFTGMPLPPGDVPPQDGKVDAADFNTIKPLMTKLCSDLTTAEKLKGDLDYNGCVNVRDIFLIRQTLETRYDE